MVLQADVTEDVAPVARVRGELARLDPRLPVGARELVLHHLYAVQPVLDMVPLDQDANLVPLTGGLHDPCGRGIEAVGRARRRQARLAVGMARVVQHLHFGAGPVDGVVVLAGAVKDPAVAPWRDVPLERQLEVAELLARDDVARGRDARERAVHDLPSGRQRVHLEAAPTGGSLAVEQESPARGALGGRQRIGSLGGEGGSDRRQQDKHGRGGERRGASYGHRDLGTEGGRRVGQQHYGLNTGPAMNLVVGERARRSNTLTAEHVQTYAALTGDYNPLHFDAAFAKRTKFGRLVVQGGLTTGLLHALVAMDLPGSGTVFLSQNWKFTAPVYLGDTITAAAEVVSVHPTKPVCQLRVVSEREDGETVLEGEAWCYMLAAEGGPS